MPHHEDSLALGLGWVGVSAELQPNLSGKQGGSIEHELHGRAGGGVKKEVVSPGNRSKKGLTKVAAHAQRLQPIQQLLDIQREQSRAKYRALPGAVGQAEG